MSTTSLGGPAPANPPTEVTAAAPAAGPAEAAAKKVTLQTQEVRLAMTFTGGVSLAVWMGGVAREVDLLIQASDLREAPAGSSTQPSADNAVRDFYRTLLELMDQRVSVDVLSGTSAGGINAAMLGLANARRVELHALRELWLEAGAFRTLLRDPRVDNPPSLLQGDGQMLTALSRGIDRIRNQPPIPWPGSDRLTDVFITTTLLSPEHSRFTDDYGTELEDLDHHGRFRFTEATLPDRGTGGTSGAALALAARSSASFPVAFEPSFIPFTDADADAAHPNMSAYTNTTQSRWAADGGLLVNRPIGPMLQAVFDRPADRQVRRCLVYVTPTTGTPAKRDTVNLSAPLDLMGALARDAGAVLNQSIAADLASIQDHNDRAQSASDTRLLMARVGCHLSPGSTLLDSPTWAAYLQKESASLASPVVAEIIRVLNTMGQLPTSWGRAPARNEDNHLRATALATVLSAWPRQPPERPDQAIQMASQLGHPAYDAAKATAIRLIRLGYLLASTADERNRLATLGSAVHDCRPAGRRPNLPALVTSGLQAAAGSELTLPSAVADVVCTYMTALDADGACAPLQVAWSRLSDTVDEVLAELTALIAKQPFDGGNPDVRLSRQWQTRAAAADEAGVYLAYLQGHHGTQTNSEAAPGHAGDHPDDGNDLDDIDRSGGDRDGHIALRLLGLHVSVRAVLPVLAEVEQQVELIQVSADTRSMLSVRRATAAQKLTGIQVHNFGAFYKSSWRGNDWLWGRLDGCGWMVHLLLDPRRIVEVLQNDRAAAGGYRAAFVNRLTAAFNTASLPTEALTELAYLDDPELPVPSSLPTLSMWVAQQAQQNIADREFPVLAGLMRESAEGSPSAAEISWLSKFDHTFSALRPGEPTLADTGRLLDDLPLPDETLAQEQTNRTPLFLRTLTQTGAVATAAATAMRNPPASLRPTFATARTVTRTVYAATDAAGGARATTVWLGLLLIVLGVAGLLTNSVLGIAGMIALPAGAVLLAVCLGRPVWKMAQILVALLVVFAAALPWLPAAGEPFFTWLSTRASWASVSSTKWLWAVLLLLILLPPVTTLADWVRRRRPHHVTAVDKTAKSARSREEALDLKRTAVSTSPPPAPARPSSSPPKRAEAARGTANPGAEPVIATRSQQPATNQPNGDDL